MIMTNRRKTSISLTVSQLYLNKMNQLIKTGKFSSTSDIINVSVSMYLGKIAVYENDPNFNYLKTIQPKENDGTPKKRISVTYSEFLDEELGNLVAMTQKNKSLIVRIALQDFFDYYTGQHSEPATESNVITRNNLKELIRELINEIETENGNEKQQ